MGELIHYHGPINVPFFLCIVIKTDTDRGRTPFMTDIGTSQARGLAADDVLFIQQITGDTGGGLQGDASDAFFHFPGISRVRRSQRREGFAEDFSLACGISAAELTHIDYERKRMTRYFKPLQGTLIIALHMIAKLTADRAAASLTRTGQCYIIGTVDLRYTLLMETGQMKPE